MIQLVRSFVVGTVLSVGGVVFVAAVELALEALAPEFSDQRIGSTNVSTIAQGVAAVIVFFVFGFFGTRWMRSRTAGFWLLLPLASLYAAAIILNPEIYRPNPEAIGGALIIHSPFLLPLLATVVGYICFRARHARAV